VCVALCAALLPVAAAAGAVRYTAGADGVGDPYFPLDGNGGYDASHYLLDVRYDPATDVLSGVATIDATATQNLSTFNLDFDGLTVRSITVNGEAAKSRRRGGELTVDPAGKGIDSGAAFRTVVRYDGIPETLPDTSGFIHTDDGALVIGEPHVAATWYPVNDHPIDKAAYTFRVTVPAGLEAVANGVLVGQATSGSWTTWTWDAQEPMASYLTTATIGEFSLRAYQRGGIKYWDAIDPNLFVPPPPPPPLPQIVAASGDQFLYSGAGDFLYSRVARTIDVPAAGATLDFAVWQEIEEPWDFLIVEARTPGGDDWTTLPDANGHTSQDPGASCQFERWHAYHPFLAHYQTMPQPPSGEEEPDPCTATGTTGVWNAATGETFEWQPWSVDLAGWAGGQVEVSIAYVTDETVAPRGVGIDDIVVSTGQGSTGFEGTGAAALNGWAIATEPPAGSEPLAVTWSVTDLVEAVVEPPQQSFGEVAEESLARQPEIIRFLSGVFGPYPWSASGGIVDNVEIGFALENQTRPIYSPFFFFDSFGGDSVIVHELAHQWTGDSVAVEEWQHIWLNEGFATYAEWLWSEEEDFATTQEIFDFFYNEFEPPESEFWELTIGDPGADRIFDFAVYARGAMTLQVLRNEVGDADFFSILETWVAQQSGGHGTTDEFVALAEGISGEQLDELFEAWLFTPGLPALDGAAASSLRAGAAESGEVPVAARNLIQRLGEKSRAARG
jgi:hypothetical protein